ncbi:hypothetical protein HNP99_001737 [Flavobacterium sp. 28A]|nr:hypothetical protein [Flavobacterium sp. 28A]
MPIYSHFKILLNIQKINNQKPLFDQNLLLGVPCLSALSSLHAAKLGGLSTISLCRKKATQRMPLLSLTQNYTIAIKNESSKPKRQFELKKFLMLLNLFFKINLVANFHSYS